MPEQLFSDIAQDKAKTIFEAGAGRKNKSTQLRKFYDELVMWHDKVTFEQGSESKALKYKELAPFIKMLNAKVAYARGRDHVDLCFEKLFSHVIRQIADPDTLKHAKLFMEAFMGFYKAEEK
ncbi:MAG: type III-A CRISPR-associated protein Csm2 [Dechloromonas sp.]|nr:type III-A CRISPR-associated protein Csm2 [Dechloromonas sp.]